mmetsp:Transcript_38780/g.44119  ORF Transcript_38780/g.44119 Transcript_38780/m.44119 type:complete len:494 (-) Transcript_38780:360-1841(-)
MIQNDPKKRGRRQKSKKYLTTQKRDKKMVDVNINKDRFVSEGANYKEKYKIGPVLGSGAFAEVRKVTHRDTGKPRAMKIISKKSLDRSELHEQFLTEIKILKTLDHPNILKVYEFYQDEKRYYIISEYLTGGELFDKIIEKGSFSETDAAHIMKQILSAVYYCHSHNIVHRDLKPENLLLEDKSENFNIKVIDWGTSQVFDPNKKMRHKYGTPYYIAPEVLKKKYDEKCDIWSCGVIMYILLCGFPPFGGNNDNAILQNVLKGKYDYNSPEWEPISAKGKDLIDKMLTYNPAERITAEQALQHPWIKENDDTTVDNKVAISGLNKLKSFRAEQKLQQATLTYIASQLASKDETEELKALFQSLDINGDGMLSRDEIKVGYGKLIGEEAAEEEVEKIFQTCDTDGSGTLDYTEFIVATLDKKAVLSKEKLESTFKMFDKDGSGSISASEITSVLGGTPESDQYWEEIIKEVDQNGDGEIQLAEFKDMMIKFYEN